MNNKLDLIKIINTILNFLDKDLDFEKSQDLTFRDLKLKISSLLVTNPKIVASICKRSIDGRKEIVYINNFWRIIMLAIKIIPERIFKRFSFKKFIFYNRKNLIKCLIHLEIKKYL